MANCNEKEAPYNQQKTTKTDILFYEECGSPTIGAVVYKCNGFVFRIHKNIGRSIPLDELKKVIDQLEQAVKITEDYEL